METDTENKDQPKDNEEEKTVPEPLPLGINVAEHVKTVEKLN